MFQRVSKKILKFSAILCVLSVLSGINVLQVEAATLSFSPSTKTVSVGNIVTTKVIVDTSGKFVNNVDGIVQFPTDMLEVVSVNNKSSIFSLWVEEPKFSNIEGKITFNGGIPTPGYIGSAGEVVSVTFRAKKTGTASLSFIDSSVRENDGLGTDILTAKQTAVIEIGNSIPVEVPPTITPNVLTVSKPVIISTTHPDQNAWYQGKTVSFNWIIPTDVTSIQTSLDKNPNSIPVVSYDSSVSQKTVSNLTDDILYFHLRYLNASGWGPTAHYKIQIDSTAPEVFSPSVRLKENSTVVTLKAKDVMSGISSYILKVDKQPIVKVKKDMLVQDEYTLPVQLAGDHTLYVQAVDMAGNVREAKVSFTSPRITSPSLSLSSNQLTKGDTVTVHGETQYPHTKVIVYVQQEGEDIVPYTVTTASDGTYGIEALEFGTSGTFKVWSQLMFSDYVKSEISEQVLVRVQDTKFVRTTIAISTALALLIPLVALALLLIIMLYIGWHKFFSLKRKITRELDAVREDTHKSLKMFKDELTKQLGILEKAKEDRDLNRKEEKIFKELQARIDGIDDIIEKKLKRIK